MAEWLLYSLTSFYFIPQYLIDHKNLKNKINKTHAKTSSKYLFRYKLSY